MDVLLVSPDERSRQLMALSVRSIERRLGQELRFRAARNGELGTTAALRDRPDVIVADEIASRAGAFGLARTLRDAAEPYTGVIVILLDRKHDTWLAKWSGADAWFVKPVDPFELADRLLDLVTEPKTSQRREGERVKIKGTCKRDGREFFAEQVVDLGGECPWDGEPFNADYAATLVESLREAERLGIGARAGARASRFVAPRVHLG